MQPDKEPVGQDRGSRYRDTAENKGGSKGEVMRRVLEVESALKGLWPQRDTFESGINTVEPYGEILEKMVDDGDMFTVQFRLPEGAVPNLIVDMSREFIRIRARWSEERVEPEGRFEWRESHFYELDRKIAFPEYVNPDTARAMAKGNILKIMVMKEEATNASGISIPAFIK